MSVKFVSKNSNYMVVLRSGIQGNRALGTTAISGLYVKFLSGVVDVKEEEVIKLMRDHPDCGTHFMEIKPEETDPYEDDRIDSEPQHVTSEVKYGYVQKAKGSVKSRFTPKQRKLIEGEALKMLPKLLKKNPDILKGILVEMAKEVQREDIPKEGEGKVESVETTNESPKVETTEKSTTKETTKEAGKASK